MSGPVVRSSSSAAGQTGGTFGVSKPAGTASGDLLLAFQANNNGTSPTPPSGFTRVASVSYSLGNTYCLSLYAKAAGSSEPSSYTFNNVGGLDTSDVWLVAVSGGDAANAPEVTSTNSGTSSTATGTSVTTAHASDLLLVGFAAAGNVTFTPDGNLTDLGTLASNPSLDVAYRALGGAGASGNDTATISNSLDWAAVMAAVQQAAGGAARLVGRPLLYVPQPPPALFE